MLHSYYAFLINTYEPFGPGTAPWIHSRVDPRQLAHAHVVEQSFLRAAVARWRQDGPSPPARYIGRG